MLSIHIVVEINVKNYKCEYVRLEFIMVMSTSLDSSAPCTCYQESLTFLWRGSGSGVVI